MTHDMLNCFDGIFAMTILDENTGHFVAARDAMGICPMYWGKAKDGSIWFSSEMKGLHSVCTEWFDIFPPVRITLLRSCWHLRTDVDRCLQRAHTQRSSHFTPSLKACWHNSTASSAARAVCCAPASGLIVAHAACE